LTTPSDVSSRLLSGLDPDLAQALASIRYVSTAVVSLGYRPQPGLPDLDGFGFIIPKTEGRRITACTWTSTKFDQRAPENHVLIRCFLGGPGREEIAEQEDEVLVGIVREELESILDLQATPDVTSVAHWHKANPQYDLGHLERVAQMKDQAADHPGLALAGCSYDGVGVPDCIRQAEEATEQVWSGLNKQI
jgi:oxygen-dependent protoporphyrinogen oxidase